VNKRTSSPFVAWSHPQVSERRHQLCVGSLIRSAI
jgi:hypothetical protein